MNVRNRRAAWRRTALLAAAAAAAPFCAATDNWSSASSGPWSTAGNWSAGLPTAGSDVIVTTPGSFQNITVTYDATVAAANATVNSLTVDTALTGALIAFTQTAKTLTVTKDVTVGNAGRGAFTLNGGTTSIGGTLYLGNAPGSFGSYTLSAGTLSNSKDEQIGVSGNGVFNQSSGNNVALAVELGYNSGSSGTYNVSGDARLSSQSLVVGDDGSGLLTQTGGVVVANELDMSGFGSGTYALSGSGVLTSGNEEIGLASVATFNQSGGSNTATNLYVGTGGAGGQGVGTGNYAMSNGAMLSVSGTEFVATGTFNQTGGSHTAGVLQVGGQSTLATFTLGSGATLAVAGSEYVGYQGPGVFNQTGGTHSVAAALIVSNSPGASSGTFNLLGGVLTAGTVQVNVGGVFNLLGGTVVAGVFSLNGGLLAGSYTNTTTFNSANGTITGRLLNQGVASLAGSFTAGNGIENDTSLAVVAGQTVTANGTGFANEGTLNFSGGTIAATSFVNDGSIIGYGTLTGSGVFTNNGYLAPGTGTLALAVSGPKLNLGNIVLAAGRPLTFTSTLTNSGSITLAGTLISGTSGLANTALGTVSGYGTLSAPFTNGGSLIAQGGVLTVSRPFVNTNFVQIAGPGATLNGVGLTNAATLQGNGGVGLPVDNPGTIEAVGGTLSFNGTLTNEPTGLIRAATGTKVLVSSGLATNPGLISLAGGTFDNGGKPLVNTGQITGYGTFAAGSTTNAVGASINVAGGSAIFNGPLVNAAGGTVHVNVAAAVFTGTVTNNGTFRVDSGSATFTAGFVNNGAYISDPSLNTFDDLTLGGSGALVGGAGDRFTLTGSLHSASRQSRAWNTLGATLQFSAGGSAAHGVDVNGVTDAGYVDNFAWGTLEVGPGQTIVLQDAVGTGDAALYAATLQLENAPASGLAAFILSSIRNADGADPVNIYYDPSQPANAYLADQSYALGNGGELAPATSAATPEPVGLSCLAVGAGCLLHRRRRSARRPASAPSTNDYNARLAGGETR